MSYVDYNSQLVRNGWVREGLIQAASKSFWDGYTGNTADSIIVQENDMTVSEGKTIVFDYDGNLASKAIKGSDTAFGKGENKKKFSNSLTVARYRFVTNNGDAFDGLEIGDLSLTQHEDSRSKLGDLFIRAKDQAVFDVVQGIKDATPSHIISLGTTFDYNSLLSIENKIKTSGYVSPDTGSIRRPLQPYRLNDGKPCWLFIMDSAMATMLKLSTSYQSLIYNADVRGSDNRAIKGVFGKIGSLILVEADSFFGVTDTDASTFGLHSTSTEISGLRRKDANGKWTGQPSFNSAIDLTSRGVILGANAIQMGFGKMPDYKLQESTDFKIKSESCLEVWWEVQKTVLLAEKEDYEQAKVAGIDYGIVAVDVKTQDVA